MTPAQWGGCLASLPWAELSGKREFIVRLVAVGVDAFFLQALSVQFAQLDLQLNCNPQLIK